MSKTRLAILIFSLLVISCPLIAQNDDDDPRFPAPELSQSISSSIDGSGVATVHYPADWYGYVDEENLGFPVFSLSNSPVGEPFFLEETFPRVPGEVYALVLMLDLDIASVLIGETDDESAAEQFIEQFTGIAGDGSDVTTSEISSFTINDRHAADVTVSETIDNQVVQGYVGVVEFDTGWGLVVAQTVDPDFAVYMPTLRAILSALEYMPEGVIVSQDTNVTQASGEFVDARGGTVNVDVPEGWSSTIVDDHLILANDDSVIDYVLFENETPQIGDVLVSVSTFPRADVDNLTNLSANPDLQETLIDIFATNVDLTFADAFPVLQFGTAQTVSLGNSEEVSVIEGTFILNGTQYELTVIVRTVRSEEIVFVAYGDDIRPFRDILLDLAASAQYER